MKKKYLQELVLSWSTSVGGDDDVDGLVLQDLQPHPNFKALSIQKLGGARLPHWVSSGWLV
ncbi:hypothetical protein Scep_010655 [Stephania cephalantha]|uniref:R13L1/DRL21-like LRR repeat region domain-containing protein n=1 Tax=Stephania cephalantha TaxID=152367 RepID=A0AAP0JW88_9MAGN